MGQVTECARLIADAARTDGGPVAETRNDEKQKGVCKQFTVYIKYHQIHIVIYRYGNQLLLLLDIDAVYDGHRK